MPRSDRKKAIDVNFSKAVKKIGSLNKPHIVAVLVHLIKNFCVDEDVTKKDDDNDDGKDENDNAKVEEEVQGQEER